MTDTPDNDHTPEEPLGPQDQAGFDHLEPHPDHPEAKRRRAEAEARSNAAVSGEDPPMGILDHLADLRKVLIDSSLAAFAGAVLAWFVSAQLLEILINPIIDEGIYFTAPNEAFMTRLKLAGAAGLFVVAPFIFFKIYLFVLPGLHKKEKKVVTPLLIATAVLFYAGVAFAYLVVIPQVITFLLGFGTEFMSPLIGVGPYFNFVSRLCLAFGLVFQLPILVLFLSVLGVVNPRMLLKTWRFAIIVVFTLSAVLTPPDVVSQVMMAGPVLVLYLVSVLVAILVTRNRPETGLTSPVNCEYLKVETGARRLRPEPDA